MFYFAYGSNMSTARLRSRVPGAHPRGRAQLAEFSLIWNKPGRDGSGKANLAPETGGCVWGVVFELPAGGLERLDPHEPGYRRELWRVTLDTGSELECATYRYPGGVAGLLPRDDYVAHMVSGAREHGLPAAYVEALARVPVLPEDGGPG